MPRIRAFGLRQSAIGARHALSWLLEAGRPEVLFLEGGSPRLYLTSPFHREHRLVIRAFFRAVSNLRQQAKSVGPRGRGHDRGLPAMQLDGADRAAR